MARHMLVVVLVALGVSGCGPQEPALVTDGSQRICDPGATQLCVCAGPLQGVQGCRDDGNGWSPCECAAPDAAAGPDAPRGDGARADGALLDARRADAMPLDATLPDTALADAAAPDGVQADHAQADGRAADASSPDTAVADASTGASDAGLPAPAVLARSHDELPGGACPYGGVRIEVGLDNGDGDGVAGDGALQDGEVDGPPILLCEPRRFLAQGALASPLAIGDATVGVVTFDGEVDTSASHYVVRVDPWAPYTVTLSGLASDKTLRLSDRASFDRWLCSSTQSGVIDEQCSARADGDQLFIAVDSFGLGMTPGTAFGLRVGGGYQAEGTAGAPVDTGDGRRVAMAWRGQVDRATSHYRVQVAPGATYQVALTGLSDAVELAVHDTQADGALLCATSGGPGIPAACTVVDVPASALHVVVSGATAATRGGATFVLEVQGGFTAEGRELAPIDLGSAISAAVEHTGRVDLSASVYAVRVAPGAHYAVGLRGADDDVDLLVLEGEDTRRAVCASTALQSGSERCQFTPASPRLVILVLGHHALAGGGSRFTVRVEGAHVAEGAPGGPIELGNAASQNLLHSGSVDLGASYYSFATAVGETYKVRLRDLSDDVDLALYSDARLTQRLCSAQRVGLGAELCSITAAGDRIWLVVDGSPALGNRGAAFDLSVEGPTVSLLLQVTTARGGAVPTFTCAVRRSGDDVVLSQWTYTPASRPPASVTLGFTVPRGELYEVLQQSAAECPLGAFAALRTPVAVGTQSVTVDFVLDAGEDIGCLAYPPSEGDELTPAIITYPGDLVFLRSTGPAGSYYTLRGLVPGRSYRVGGEAELPSQAIPVSLYELPYFFQTPVTPAVANSRGELYVAVNHLQNSAWLPAGARFYLDVGPTAQVNEANVVVPQPPAEGIEVEGHVGLGTSTYLVTTIEGLTYTVSLLRPSDNVMLTASTTTNVTCTSSLPRLSEESCTLQVPETTATAGRLYVTVTGNASVAGATYTLRVAPIPLDDEGTAGAPIDVTAALPRDAQVGASGSYYHLGGVVPDRPRQVRIRAATADVGLAVYSDAAFTALLCSADAAGRADEECTANPPGTSLFIKVRGVVGGARFWLGAPRYYPAEGSPVTPIDLTGTSNRFCSVDESSSYYVVRGLSTGRGHDVTVVNASGPVELLVYDSADFSASWRCASPRLTSLDAATVPTCLAVSDDGELFIEVRAPAARPVSTVAGTHGIVDPLTYAGAGFRLAVTDGGVLSERRTLRFPDDFPHTGLLGRNGPAVYALEGLEPIAAEPAGAGCAQYYTATLQAVPVPLLLVAEGPRRLSSTEAQQMPYLPLGGGTGAPSTARLCSASAAPGSAGLCVDITTRDGAVQLLVGADANGDPVGGTALDGATFTLTLAPLDEPVNWPPAPYKPSSDPCLGYSDALYQQCQRNSDMQEQWHTNLATYNRWLNDPCRP